MQHDWSNAPAWAHYHAFDSNWVGYYHEAKPFAYYPGGYWKKPEGVKGNISVSSFVFPDHYQYWYETLEKRGE